MTGVDRAERERVLVGVRRLDDPDEAISLTGYATKTPRLGKVGDREAAPAGCRGLEQGGQGSRANQGRVAGENQGQPLGAQNPASH